MKVADYALAMQTSHGQSQQSSVKESLRVWVSRPVPADTVLSHQSPSTQVAISAAARQQQASEITAIDDAMHNAENDPELHILILMIEKMTGQKIRLLSSDDLRPISSAEQPAITATPAPPTAPRAGFGVEYDRVASYSESEQTTMQAAGIIKTSDGKEISFSLNLVMQRQYSETSSTSLRLGDAARKTDPLIINFGGTAAQLSEQRFAFDLDSDGKNEQINSPLSGSGFLTLDRNGDGKINNGSELFGPATGNGFSELAQYDGDGNNWIDENDAVYQQLQVWTRDTAGNNKLASLAALGVGAVSLQAADTPFDIKTTSNQLLGSVLTSSVFLNENGTAGSVQQIDLTV